MGSVLSVARAQHIPDGRHEFVYALIQGAAPCGTLDPLCLQRNRQLVDALVGFLESLPNLLKALSALRPAAASDLPTDLLVRSAFQG